MAIQLYFFSIYYFTVYEMREYPSIPTICILFIRLFFVYKGGIRFPDTDRQQSSGTRELFALRFSGYTVQTSNETFE